MNIEKLKNTAISALEHVKAHKGEAVEFGLLITAQKTASLLGVESPQIDTFLYGMGLNTLNRFVGYSPRRSYILTLAGVIASGVYFGNDNNPDTSPFDAFIIVGGSSISEAFRAGVDKIRRGSQRIRSFYKS